MERLTKSKKVKRQKKHGFMIRMSTHGGRKTLARRRKSKRVQISI